MRNPIIAEHSLRAVAQRLLVGLLSALAAQSAGGECLETSGSFKRMLRSGWLLPIAVWIGLAAELSLHPASLDSWKVIPPPARYIPGFNAVVYGNGLFVAVGYSGGGTNAYISTDGYDWLPSTINSGGFLQPTDIIYANGRFVVASLYFSSSTDGVHWTNTYAPGPKGPLDAPERLAYDHGIFLSCDYWHKTTWTSPDGQNWVQSFNDQGSPQLRLWGLAGGNGKFLANYGVGFDSPQLFASSDGTSWTAVPGAPVLGAIAFLNGQFIGGPTAGSGRFYHSTNGMDWLADGLVSDTYQGGFLTYGNGKYVRTTSSKTYASSDLVHWSASSSFIDLGAVTFGKGLFVGVSGVNVLESTNGVDWQILQFNDFSLQSAAFGIGRFVTVASMPTGLARFTGYSVDSTTSDTREFSIPSRQQTRSFVLFGPPFIGGTDSGDIFSSIDGDAWTNSAAWPAYSWQSGVFARNEFYLYGTSNSVAKSKDGVNWNISFEASLPALGATAFGNDTFVGISGSALYRSLDGSNWQTLPGNAPPLVPASVIFGNGLFLVFGRSTESGGQNAVYSSSDGVVWKPSVVGRMSSGAYGNGRFIGFGFGLGVYESADALQWVPHPIFGLFRGVYGDGRFLGIGDHSYMALSDLVPAPFQVAARDAAFSAEAATGSSAAFSLERSGDLGFGIDLHVRLTYGGSATNGVDYELMPDVLIIPAGQKTALFQIVPKPRSDPANKVVEISVQSGEAYTVTQSALARVQIENHPVSLIFSRNSVMLNQSRQFQFSLRNPLSGQAQLESSTDLTHWATTPISVPPSTLTNLFQRNPTNRQEYFRSRQ